MPDTVEATRQDVGQEPPDKLVGREGYDTLAFGAIATVIFVAERDALLVEADQTPVGDGDPVGIAGQVGEHRFRTRKGRLCINHSSRLPDRRQMTQEGVPSGE